MPKDIGKTTIQLAGLPAFSLESAQSVLAHGGELAAEDTIKQHQHPRGQLLWAERGVLRVTTEKNIWIVPSSHAVWIPSGAPHHVVSETASRVRNLYIDQSLPVRSSQDGCIMLLMSPLMREIILRLTTLDYAVESSIYNRLGLVAIDEINSLTIAPLSLPAGRDDRLRKLIGHMVKNPDCSLSLAQLSNLVGGSVRTMERLFSAETGMSFRQWRTRLKLLSSIEQLRMGKSSTTIAHSLGYRSASAFVAMFRQHFGCTPQSFLTIHKEQLNCSSDSTKDILPLETFPL